MILTEAKRFLYRYTFYLFFYIIFRLQWCRSGRVSCSCLGVRSRLSLNREAARARGVRGGNRVRGIFFWHGRRVPRVYEAQSVLYSMNSPPALPRSRFRGQTKGKESSTAVRLGQNFVSESRLSALYERCRAGPGHFYLTGKCEKDTVRWTRSEREKESSSSSCSSRHGMFGVLQGRTDRKPNKSSRHEPWAKAEPLASY